MTDFADDPLEYDPAAGSETAGRTERQHAIAALIAGTIIANGIDHNGAISDVSPSTQPPSATRSSTRFATQACHLPQALTWLNDIARTW